MGGGGGGGWWLQKHSDASVENTHHHSSRPVRSWTRRTDPVWLVRRDWSSYCPLVLVQELDRAGGVLKWRRTRGGIYRRGEGGIHALIREGPICQNGSTAISISLWTALLHPNTRWVPRTSRPLAWWWKHDDTTASLHHSTSSPVRQRDAGWLSYFSVVVWRVFDAWKSQMQFMFGWPPNEPQQLSTVWFM